MKDKPRIIFFGTPDFAVASLETLINNGFHVAGVVTAADKPAGRGKHLNSSPVKKYALQKGLYLMQGYRISQGIAYVKSGYPGRRRIQDVTKGSLDNPFIRYI